jgi:hypothetical protein
MMVRPQAAAPALGFANRPRCAVAETGALARPGHVTAVSAETASATSRLLSGRTAR